MSRTLGDLRGDLRDRLDETSARFWDDKQLNRWVNEGATDISRRAQVLLASSAIAVVAGTQTYALPSTGFVLHRAEFSPDSGVTVYPLEFRDMNEMDEIWATRRTTQNFAPAYAVINGYSPNWTMLLYPVPSTSGTLTVYYYRQSTNANSDTDQIDTPTGWEDLVILYAQYVALRKDRDGDWQLAKQEYEEKLAAMIDTTRRLHDQAGYITTGANFLPGWLVMGDGDF